MKVADEVWTSVALLHQENPERPDFAVEEIKARARRENWPIRQGFNVHASYHCVANKPANPANHRMLYEDSRGRKRLYRPGDPFHSERENGKIRPDKLDLPPAYQSLIEWYDAVYSRRAQSVPRTGTPSIKPTVSGGTGLEKSLALTLSNTQGMSRTAFVSPTGSVVIPENLRRELGIQEGTCISIYREKDFLVLQPITNEFIHSLVGCLKGEDSLVDAREREHRLEKR